MAVIESIGPKRRLALLFSFLLWISASIVLATPIGLASPNLEKRKPSFPSLDDCKKKFTAPAKDTAMYFTGLKTRTDINGAKKYATDHGLVHVGLSYPDGFTNPNQYDGTDDERRKFQENFSRLYAQGTEGIAYLLIDDDKQPADDSIFQTVEFPEMRDGAKVSKILRFPKSNNDPKNSDNEYWPDDAGAACLDYQGPPPCPSKRKRSILWEAASKWPPHIVNCGACWIEIKEIISYVWRWLRRAFKSALGFQRLLSVLSRPCGQRWRYC